MDRWDCSKDVPSLKSFFPWKHPEHSEKDIPQILFQRRLK